MKVDFIAENNEAGRDRGKTNSLAEDEIHICSASLLDYENELDYLTSILSEDERVRAKKFKFSKDEKLFILARGILRCLLASYLDTFPENIKIVYGLWGKPCLEEGSLLHFNVSHSGIHALYAFTCNYEVGVDLEYIDENINLKEVDLNMFSSIEQEYLKVSNDKVQAFFNIWVGMEAILKTLGKGWLSSEQTIQSRNSNLLIHSLMNSPDNIKISYPVYFNCIPGYASAVFVDGPFLFLHHYKFNHHPLQKFKR